MVIQAVEAVLNACSIYKGLYNQRDQVIGTKVHRSGGMLPTGIDQCNESPRPMIREIKTFFSVEREGVLSLEFLRDP